MNTIKKLMLAACVAAVGLCGTAWAAEEDFTFDSTTGTITGYTGAGGDVEIPAQIGGVTVRAIKDRLFLEKLALTSVTIPAGVTNIGVAAFNKCGNLVNVTFAPDSQLKEIGQLVFAACPLTSITLPEGLTDIGQMAFMECPLTGITLPEGMTDIGQMAFAICTNLTEITIPAGVTNIGMGAFCMCSNLTEVTVLAIEPPAAGQLLFAADESETPIASLKAIKVPAGTVDKYKKAPGWDTYTALITDGSVEPVEYFAWDETEKKLVAQTCTTYTVVTDTMETLASGWYVVQGQVTIDRTGAAKPGLRVAGDAHLILADGAELVVTGAEKSAGIAVDVDGATTNSLAIYGQVNQTGRLTATGVNGAAGIGGDEHDTCGTVTINGGIVTAKGGASEGGGAGIGGGWHGAGGTVTVNGGVVTAMGNLIGGAGIGGGAMGAGGAVTINGGTVRAVSYGEYGKYAGGGGAGIGGGVMGVGGTVAINGGEVTAISYVVYYGEAVCSDGIGAGMSMEGLLPFGTLDMSGYTGAHIYAGMDTNGVEVAEVQAGDYATWHTNCYVQITATKRPEPGSPEVKIVSAKSERPGGEWNGTAQVVYSLENLDAAKTYELAVEILAAGQFAAKTNDIAPVSGVYTQEVKRTEFFGIESTVEDREAQLTLKLIEK